MQAAIRARTCTRAGLGALILTFAAAPALAQRQAAIAAPDRYGAQAAATVLRAGGNAVDAAVAMGFALAVTLPEAGNLGGGGLATVVMDGKPAFLDYRERAPASATRDMYLDAHGEVIPDASTIGAGAAAVPGTVAGLWALHQRYGRLSWRADLAPALHYARDGFRVPQGLAEGARARAADLHGRTNFAHYFGGLEADQRFVQPELAHTLERIAQQGPAGFYAGRTAELIVAEMSRSGGHIEARDLAAYRPRWRAPLQMDWAGYRVVTAPPPSAGGVMLLSLLDMKARLAERFAQLPANSAQYVHLEAEMEKRVFADRAEYLGDPDFFPVPVAQLLDPAYLARRTAEVATQRPTPLDQVHPGLRPAAAMLQRQPETEHHQTTHYSILDGAGNAVAITYTLNDTFGSGQVVSGAGFLLNDEMDDFSIRPGTPNMFGVVGGEADAIEPGKRPLSSMTPTILLRGGEVMAVLGTPGGSRIPTTLFQVIVHWHDDHMSPRAALATARIHHQLLPPDVIIEESWAPLGEATRRELAARGYRFEQQGWPNGDVQLVLRGERGPEAHADPRGRGVGLVLSLPAKARS